MDIDNVPVDYYSSVLNYNVESLWSKIPLTRVENTPRFECWMNDYNLPYTYGTGRGVRTYEPLRFWTPEVNTVREILDTAFNTTFDCCFVNGYIDEKHQLGWHADDSPEMDPAHPIASVSFGAARDIWFRKNGEKGMATKGVNLSHGSVVMMRAGMQAEWEHRIPKASYPCGPRISMTFRKLIV